VKRFGQTPHSGRSQIRPLAERRNPNQLGKSQQKKGPAKRSAAPPPAAPRKRFAPSPSVSSVAIDAAARKPRSATDRVGHPPTTAAGSKTPAKAASRTATRGACLACGTRRKVMRTILDPQGGVAMSVCAACRQNFRYVTARLLQGKASSKSATRRHGLCLHAGMEFVQRTRPAPTPKRLSSSSSSSSSSSTMKRQRVATLGRRAARSHTDGNGCMPTDAAPATAVHPREPAPLPVTPVTNTASTAPTETPGRHVSGRRHLPLCDVCLTGSGNLQPAHGSKAPTCRACAEFFSAETQRREAEDIDGRGEDRKTRRREAEEVVDREENRETRRREAEERDDRKGDIETRRREAEEGAGQVENGETRRREAEKGDCQEKDIEAWRREAEEGAGREGEEDRETQRREAEKGGGREKAREERAVARRYVHLLRIGMRPSLIHR